MNNLKYGILILISSLFSDAMSSSTSTVGVATLHGYEKIKTTQTQLLTEEFAQQRERLEEIEGGMSEFGKMFSDAGIGLDRHFVQILSSGLSQIEQDFGALINEMNKIITDFHTDDKERNEVISEALKNVNERSKSIHDVYSGNPNSATHLGINLFFNEYIVDPLKALLPDLDNE